MPAADGGVAEGDVLEVRAGRPVHGGCCIAHAAGATVMLRHALPGELVRAVVTRVRARVVDADAIEVLEASADRVVPPCALVGHGGCGGCDLQHASREAQLRWKGEVIVDALRRQGGLDDVTIDALGIRVRALDDDGLHWRTSVRWHSTTDGRPGFLRWHSSEVLPVPACPVLDPVLESAMTGARGAGSARVGSAPASSAPASSAQSGSEPWGPGRRAVTGEGRTTQRVADRTWRISSDSFWQPHREAPAALVEEALRQGVPSSGEVWWDLYAGAGLFTAFLALAVGREGSVIAVESAPSAVRDARRALHDLPWARLEEAAVGTWLRSAHGPVDGVLLDPPRAGAGEPVVRAIAAARPSRVVMVSCDPVTAARDIRAFVAAGYRLSHLAALDCFPMTHHVETVATLLPAGPGDEIS